MPLLDTCKFEEAVIKTEVYHARALYKMAEILNLSEILCLSLLSGNLVKFQ